MDLGESYFQHTFDNGLVLLGEKIPGMQSAAMTFLLPAGTATDPFDRSGSSNVLSDLIIRGAGERDSRQVTDALDHLGLDRSSGAGVHHLRMACAGLAQSVLDALPIYADIIRRPRLPRDGFEAARDLAIQSLDGLEDDPRQTLMIKLREWHLPYPLGRSTMGKREDLEKLTVELCREDFERRFAPNGSIVALAGNIDWPRVQDAVGAGFATWPARMAESIELIPPPGIFHHQTQESEQTHIGVAFRTIEETDKRYYAARLAFECLSGGMSGRLFTELREKRGLVYNVAAGYTALKGIGSVMGYAGTSNDRAQATLDCLLHELRRLSDGVHQDELARAKIGLKAGTIMSGESTVARAAALAHDFFMRGRVRTLEEIKAAIDAVTQEAVNQFLAQNRPGAFTIVTVGPKALTAPES